MKEKKPYKRTWEEAFKELRMSLFEEAYNWWIEVKKSEEQNGMYDRYAKTLYDAYFTIIVKNGLYEKYQEYCKNKNQ